MTRTIRVAAVQMDANPAPTAARLDRAAALIEQAARAGADLVVLPELFNTGYSYEASVITRAEREDGPTARLLADAARRHGVLVAGSLMLLERRDVFNALLLCGPGGERWRYDKVYPWGWERAAFRGSRSRTVVAETPLGRIGLLVCWDTAHPDLWRDYAGKVDLVLMTSCPPNVGRPTYQVGDDSKLRHVPLGVLGGAAETLFGEMIDEQVAWLGVPAVNTVGCGRITTPLPLLPALKMTCDLTPGCKVLDASGRHVAERAQSEGEGWALGEVEIGDRPRSPRGTQPVSRLPRLAYLLSDVILPALMEGVYRAGVARL